MHSYIKIKYIVLNLTVLILFYGLACGQNTIVTSRGENKKFPLAAVKTSPTESGIKTTGLPQTHQKWEQLFSSAEESIDIGMFYMISKDNSRLEDIISIIKEKARQGVKIRVVTDNVFYRNYPDIPDELSRLENSSVKIIDLDSLTGGVMHAKYFIIDRSHFYAGSANFDWRSLEHICEIGIGGTDQNIAGDLTKIFDIDYKIAKGENPEDMETRFHSDSSPDYEKLHHTSPNLKSWGTQITATPPVITPENIILTEELIIKLINTARNNIFINMFQYGLTSSYAPGYYDHIDRALRRAASQGVNIEFLVSDWALTEHQQVHLKSLQVIPQIEIRYTQIPRAKEGFIPFARVDHSKLMIVDGQAAWVGSSNWQPGYFDQSRNVGLVIDSKEKIKELARYFKTTWDSDYAHFLKIDHQYSPPARVKGD